jgi:hypothetical protein
MKYNFKIVETVYVDDNGPRKIRQSELACIQVYLSFPLDSEPARCILGEKLAKMIERFFPGLHVKGNSLDYEFWRMGEWGKETSVFSIV